MQTKQTEQTKQTNPIKTKSRQRNNHTDYNQNTNMDKEPTWTRNQTTDCKLQNRFATLSFKNKILCFKYHIIFH